jgi:hypothetical protein
MSERWQNGWQHVLGHVGFGQVRWADAGHLVLLVIIRQQFRLLTNELELGLDQRDALLAKVILMYGVRT